MVFPIILHTLFCIITHSISKINGMQTLQFITLFCCKKPSETLVLLCFLSTSCLLLVSEDMRFEPTIGLCSSTPQGNGGVLDGFIPPLLKSLLSHLVQC